jgi:plasmid stability protein
MQSVRWYLQGNPGDDTARRREFLPWHHVLKQGFLVAFFAESFSGVPVGTREIGTIIGAVKSCIRLPDAQEKKVKVRAAFSGRAVVERETCRYLQIASQLEVQPQKQSMASACLGGRQMKLYTGSSHGDLKVQLHGSYSRAQLLIPSTTLPCSA